MRTIPLKFFSLDRPQSASLLTQGEQIPQMTSSAIHRVLTFVAFLGAFLLLCHALQPTDASRSNHSPRTRVPQLLLLDAPHLRADASTKGNNKGAALVSSGEGISVLAGRGKAGPHVGLRGEERPNAAARAAAGAYLYFKLELLANYCLFVLPLLPDSLQPIILRSTIVFGMQELSVLSVLCAGEFEEERRRTFEAFLRLKDEACKRLTVAQLKDFSIHELSAMLDHLRQLDIRPIPSLGQHHGLLDMFLPSSEQAIIQFSVELKTLMGCARRTGTVDEDVSDSVQSVLAAITAGRLQQILEAPEVSATLVARYYGLPLASETVENTHLPSMQAKRSALTQGMKIGHHGSGVWTVPVKPQRSTDIASTGLERKVSEPLAQKNHVKEVQQLQPGGVPLKATEAGVSQSSKPPQSVSENPSHFLMNPIEPAPRNRQKHPVQLVKPTPIYKLKQGDGPSMAEGPKERDPQP
ncbi:hypothetical protein ACSSS7_001336 [Eimeria intestinalis]